MPPRFERAIRALSDARVEFVIIGGFSAILHGSALAEVELYGCKVRNLSLTDLLKSKRAAGRVKDLQVIPELESILEALEQKRSE